MDIFYESNKNQGFLSHVYNLCMDLSIEHMKISTGFSASQDTIGTVHSVNSNDRYRALVDAYPGLFAHRGGDGAAEQGGKRGHEDAANMR